MTNPPDQPHEDAAQTDQNPPVRQRRRLGRRGLLKVAAGTGAAVAAASGVYVRPSVRPLEVPSAEAFSF